MHQYRPGRRQFPMFKAFASQRTPQKIILEDSDPTFGLRSPFL